MSNPSVVLVPAPFIVGAPRSGTTLLRLMLDAHPDMAIPAETGFFITLASASADGTYPTAPGELWQLLTSSHTWPDLDIDQDNFRAMLETLPEFSVAAGLRAFYDLYAAKHQKTRWGDKTPHHCFHLLQIQEVLPEVRFLHLIRDGRDVAVSLRETWFTTTREIGALANAWASAVQSARSAGAFCSHYLEIRFEQLVIETRQTLETVCDFLALPFHADMLRYYEGAQARLDEVKDSRQPDGRLISKSQRLEQHRRTSSPPQVDRIGRWRTELTDHELAEFEALVGPLLRQLSYMR